MLSMFKKDFYAYIPKYIQNDLEEKIKKYSNENWFLEAWEAYRNHVMSYDRKHMQSPNLFFKDYLNNQKEEVIFPEQNADISEEETIVWAGNEPLEPIEEKVLPSEEEKEEEKEEIDDISANPKPQSKWDVEIVEDADISNEEKNYEKNSELYQKNF